MVNNIGKGHLGRFSGKGLIHIFCSEKKIHIVVLNMDV